MNKVCVITDTHFGAHHGSENWLNSQLRFFRNELVPYLKANDIKHIIHLGDLFEEREQTDNMIFDTVFKLFNEDLLDFEIYQIVGNHDSYYKDKIDTTVLRFLEKFENVKLIDEISLVNILGRDILLVPWLTDHRDFAIRVSNKNLDCDVCMGHFDISTFLMNKSSISTKGLQPSMFFKNWKLVFSGHFHKRSIKTLDDSEIVYIGNTFHLSRHDVGEPRGFCILDVDTLEYEFIDTYETIKFVKIKYPDSVSKSVVEGNVVDVEFSYEDFDEKEFNKYIEAIESYNPIERPLPKAIDSKISEENDIIHTESVLSLLREYVSAMDLDDDTIMNLIEGLYDECYKDAED